MLTDMAEDSGWAMWQRVIRGEEVDALEVLAMAAMYERYFEEVQCHAVGVLRAEGRTWQEIGDAVGVTKQTAWKKWQSPAEQGKELSTRLADYPIWAGPRR
jgi:hypothetical protein